ncbi:hypothetical protein OHA40_25690 [Nocardia sp. NBC_00508]|uniref:hypothetical protein n=1 Tax=Nocardia sp. NBC_00508 TaxID=2975992 RepID=UPI002E81EE32|nr:hypothetical protein [Nocardia sp. NBC_00508]WUD65027.1 hypothetical protein OHA40_25690 [Nocardia sp. NBC_00508]
MKAPKATTRHDPFEVVLCAVFGVSALLQALFGPPAGSATSSMAPGFRTLWLVLLLIGCLATLVGLFARRVWGYLVEQIGLGALGWSLMAFGAQLLVLQFQQRTLGPATILGGPLPIALGLAFLWKRRQVLQDVRTLHAVTMKEEP